ncbi:hypothetical protein GIB67_032553 [Kingdonia uniflora]|uniref:Uncharacterized protein n=1 Tax=Kingdonia uniflora TaxID=39325 RepID=A0A7J7LSA7_9MAGN|nr:hypothetical protein GIB67_032553 [Kingdonia uniflora]
MDVFLEATTLRSSYIFLPHHQHEKKVRLSSAFSTKFIDRRTTTTGVFLARSMDPERQENNPFSSEDDLNYLLKLGAGSIGGAVIIKYGSVLFSDITKPNIVQALLMIFAPMLIAVFLLVKQSRAEGQSRDIF